MRYPLFFQNKSSTNEIKKDIFLARTEKIKNGSVIVVPGRMFVVIDSENSLISSASHYEYNYQEGKFHIFKVNELFKNIETIEDLETLYSKNEGLLFKQYRKGGGNKCKEFFICDLHKLFD